MTLTQGLKALSIGYSQDQLNQLNTYLDEVEFWNKKYGLVRVDSRQDLLVRHLLDSLSGLPLIEQEKPKTVADLGSGAGFPGIPLAIMMPQCHFTLVERQGSRCQFLENSLFQLGLNNVSIFQGDLKQVKEEFDLVTFRAFRPFEDLILKGILKILSSQGRVAAYKGRLEPTETEWQQIKDSFSQGEILELKVPGLGAQRCMLWMKGKKLS